MKLSTVIALVRVASVWAVREFQEMLVASVSADKEFHEIGNVPQDVTGVRLEGNCPKNGRHARTMFTVEPSTSDQVTVSTYPANLVTAEKSGDELRLIWDTTVAYGASEGGVRIGLPVDALRTVEVSSDVHAQILGGFTSVRNLRISSDASLYATLDSLTNSTGLERLDIKVSSDASATVNSSIPLDELVVSSDGKLKLQAPFVESIRVSSDAQLALKGSADDAKVSSDAKVTLDGSLANAHISSDAHVTVYGKVTGSVQLSSDAKLYVGEEISDTASIDAKSDAQVRAPSCDRVTTKSDGRCFVDNSIHGQVVVEVPIQDSTLAGTEMCMTWNARGWNWVLALVILAGIGGGIQYCRKRRRHRGIVIHRTIHVAPTQVSDPESSYVIPEVIPLAYEVEEYTDDEPTNGGQPVATGEKV